MYDSSFPPPPPPAAKNSLAIVSLVCGITAVVTSVFNWIPMELFIYLACAAPISGLAALITGIFGIRFAGKNAGVGRGLAITGLVLGSLVAALFLLMFVAGFLIGLSQALG